MQLRESNLEANVGDFSGMQDTNSGDDLVADGDDRAETRRIEVHAARHPRPDARSVGSTGMSYQLYSCI